ncbi:hypothetical protein KIW74_gp87 [Mycobacterium phage Kimona]|uniref:Uncharacterized protein n=1 Tax=Mycobacterium phage Kimona TaxID=2024295 RepID=A0A249XTX7_9CAUD|nr:hypothetical protein KIW74_gp87 [Mycobacterium phage Kimona]ASZ75441.1 hypothetical protein PBI_KIMONA_5 [Mycobacterium phage Kimona]
MNFLTTIGKAIGEVVKPIIERELRKHAESLIPQVLDALRAELDKRIPALSAAVVTAVTEALAEATERRVDEITDVIPGELDDAVIDRVAERALDVFRRFSL